jgi:putative oxidoreductase|tara:strand:- start:774 stop:1184 length:411 start_codon:yes stop_codon:yes gene_type:complete
VNYKDLTSKIPEFCYSHWLLRIPLAIIFLQQGISKWPIDLETAASYDLPLVVWAFVTLGEIGAGVGLLIGGLFPKNFLWELGDMITRFSGITICSIMTGVIWIGQPETFMDVILYDNLHVLLWVGGLFFALRGNRT